MKIRRRYTEDKTIQTEAAADGDDAWHPTTADVLGYEPPFTGSWEREHVSDHGAEPGDLVLPLQPLSVRDFSLSEQHNLDAAWGYARRFIPGMARMAGAIRTLTGRTPGGLRPNKLWYQQPIYYLNNPFTFVPSGATVAFPPYTEALDYGLQLAFVINQPLLDAKTAGGRESHRRVCGHVRLQCARRPDPPDAQRHGAAEGQALRQLHVDRRRHRRPGAVVVAGPGRHRRGRPDRHPRPGCRGGGNRGRGPGPAGSFGRLQGHISLNTHDAAGGSGAGP